ncbi:hypothetical protein Scep_022376 [Stephania cephalantha]|uniref:Uncharacterized protein n=1 Tax=Stephania cephalantha TaxID=152367 RepID=A0AAP0F7W9_9MAGN
MKSVLSNNEEVKRERQEEAAIASPSSSKQGDSTSAPTITMRDRDEVLEKLWSKYFERISRGERSGHDSLVDHPLFSKPHLSSFSNCSRHR